MVSFRETILLWDATSVGERKKKCIKAGEARFRKYREIGVVFMYARVATFLNRLSDFKFQISISQGMFEVASVGLDAGDGALAHVLGCVSQQLLRHRGGDVFHRFS